MAAVSAGAVAWVLTAEEEGEKKEGVELEMPDARQVGWAWEEDRGFETARERGRGRWGGWRVGLRGEEGGLRGLCWARLNLLCTLMACAPGRSFGTVSC